MLQTGAQRFESTSASMNDPVRAAVAATLENPHLFSAPMQLQSQSWSMPRQAPGWCWWSAWQQGACLGSAVGEGSSAEAAKTGRSNRLLKSRLSPMREGPHSHRRSHCATARPPAPGQAPLLPASAPEPCRQKNHPGPSAPEDRTAPTDPEEDWSDELTEVEAAAEAAGLGREQEATYLARPSAISRSRLIQYWPKPARLFGQRPAPAGAEGSDPALVPPPPCGGRNCFGQCDQLLGQLRGEPARAGEFLGENTFRLSQRQQLSDENKLLQSNMLAGGVDR